MARGTDSLGVFMDPATLSALFQAVQGAKGGIGQFLQGYTGNSDRPYNKAGDAFEQHEKQAENYQNPFYQAGTGALW